jgi:1-acyl-sn-glycerol-3-phosphate acyltransferase
MRRFRRKSSLKKRAVKRGSRLRAAAPQLDIPWVRSRIVGLWRAAFLRVVLRPTMDVYTRRRANGREKLAKIKGPVILVANHSSHIDTPVILAALPRKLRKRTTVAAAADYFYRNWLVATLVSLIFNTVPIERTGGGLSQQAGRHLDDLLDQGWNLLLYPEGTRKQPGGAGRMRRGAAVLAERHHLPVVPIRVTGTKDVMPPGRLWPKRLHGKLVSKRHNVEISFGEPILPLPVEDSNRLQNLIQNFFEDGDGALARTRELGKRIVNSY